MGDLSHLKEGSEVEEVSLPGSLCCLSLQGDGLDVVLTSRREKTRQRGFRTRLTQSRPYSLRRKLEFEISDLGRRGIVLSM